MSSPIAILASVDGRFSSAFHHFLNYIENKCGIGFSNYTIVMKLHFNQQISLFYNGFQKQLTTANVLYVDQWPNKNIRRVVIYLAERNIPNKKGTTNDKGVYKIAALSGKGGLRSQMEKRSDAKTLCKRVAQCNNAQQVRNVRLLFRPGLRNLLARNSSPNPLISRAGTGGGRNLHVQLFNSNVGRKYGACQIEIGSGAYKRRTKKRVKKIDEMRLDKKCVHSVPTNSARCPWKFVGLFLSKKPNG